MDDITAAREQICEAMEAVCGQATDMSAALTATFYDGLRDMAGVDDGFSALAESQRVPQATERAVRACMQSQVEGKPRSVLETALMQRVGYEVRRASNDCVVANAKRDPAKPRYARVPSGAETCTFCLMLASRGFVYRDEQVARHSHDNCDCRIVPGFNGQTKVRGYDPQALKEQWAAYRDIEADGSLTRAEKDALKKQYKYGVFDKNHPSVLVDDLHPASLGGARRGDPMTREQADGGSPNPHYGESEGYGINCQSCVVVYEARLRGYDVEVLPRDNNPMMDDLAFHTNKAWVDPKTNAHPDYLCDTNVNTPTRCKRWLDGVVEKGNRYTLQFTWSGRKRYGHIVSLDRDEDNRLRIYDPQTGNTIVDDGSDSFDKLLERFKYEGSYKRRKVSYAPMVLRVDNMSFNEDVANAIMKGVEQ